MGDLAARIEEIQERAKKRADREIDAILYGPNWHGHRPTLCDFFEMVAHRLEMKCTCRG